MNRPLRVSMAKPAVDGQDRGARFNMFAFRNGGYVKAWHKA
jgi:methylmalonyl-CoA mutase cobalamin-binding subunit